MIARHLNRTASLWQQQNVCLALQQNRGYSAQAELKQPNEKKFHEVSLENARPFKEIPGPSKFEFMRSFMPGGMYHNKSLNEMVQVSRKRYGPIYCMPGLFGKAPIVATLNPDDYPVMFRNEGHWPYRRSLETVLYHRKVHRRDYFKGTAGLVFTNGKEWGVARTSVNPVLMKSKNVRPYYSVMQDISDEFMARIRDIRDPITNEMPADFENEIQRLTFETVCSVALNRQLGLIRKNRDSDESKKLFTSLRNFLQYSFELEIQPAFWKVIKTPKFRDMMRTLDTITELCDKYIQEALAEIQSGAAQDNGNEKSVLEKLMKINPKLAVVMAVELLMAGVDTTSTTITGILLCLGKNPAKQEKLFEEAKRNLPNKDSRLTEEQLQELPYLRACIKEAMRLYPIGAGTLRRMPHDVVLSGYRIPEGTDVMTGSAVQLWEDEYVPRSKEFIPERWLRSADRADELVGQLQRPFMYTPFGIGPRMCAGKRIVDLEMELNILRLVRNFNIGFDYPIENAFKSTLIMVPNIPLKFKFEERPL